MGWRKIRQLAIYFLAVFYLIDIHGFPFIIDAIKDSVVSGSQPIAFFAG